MYRKKSGRTNNCHWQFWQWFRTNSCGRHMNEFGSPFKWIGLYLVHWRLYGRCRYQAIQQAIAAPDYSSNTGTSCSYSSPNFNRPIRERKFTLFSKPGYKLNHNIWVYLHDVVSKIKSIVWGAKFPGVIAKDVTHTFSISGEVRPKITTGRWSELRQRGV